MTNIADARPSSPRALDCSNLKMTGMLGSQPQSKPWKVFHTEESRADAPRPVELAERIPCFRRDADLFLNTPPYSLPEGMLAIRV